MSPQDLTIFAETTFRNHKIRFGIKRDDRRRHMYLIGKTGMGKSTLLENMIVEDIRAGKGVAVVDPHGDLVEKVIKYIPSSRINDVIYFNPSDIDYPIAFNVVEQVEPHLRHLVASGLIGVFQKLWADSWGPRLEYILRNTILAIMDYPGSTLLAVVRMLSDKTFRKSVVEKVQDPIVKAFWVNEFAGYADKFAAEAVSPIQNKVGQFLSSSLIRNIVGQVKSSIDLRKVMDEKKILLLNLSKGRIGEDNSNLLGNMMITKIQLAAMSRVDIPESTREDFYLYVDEFQNFSTDSFANILSEARKYRLNLIMAHQYIEQLPEKVAAAVFGNVGTMIVFRVGAADAEALVPEFSPIFTEEDIVNLPKYEFYIKLMIDGVASDPFSARGLPPLTIEEITENVEKVIGISRERYAKERAVVEEKIMRWHDNIASSQTSGTSNGAPKTGNGQGGAPASRPPMNNRSSAPRPAAANYAPNAANTSPIPASLPQEKGTIRIIKSDHFDLNNGGEMNNSVYRFDAVCARCGKPTKTSFKPDGVRPIYCKDCLAIAKDEKKRDLEGRKAAKERELAALEAELPVKTISLQDAIKAKPVNFKGEEIQPEQPRADSPVNDKIIPENRIISEDPTSLTEIPKKSINNVQGEITEGEEVVFN